MGMGGGVLAMLHNPLSTKSVFVRVRACVFRRNACTYPRIINVTDTKGVKHTSCQ